MKKQNGLRSYLLLWGTQSLSTLGSGMTGYALVLWLYLESGSALQTALLSVCFYAPYVIVSIFAGALSDRWNKKRTMLVCDSVAAVCTVTIFLLFRLDSLGAIYLYILNALNGLMNTVQQPAGEVAATLLIPKEYYQKTSGLRSLSQSLNSILTPIFATALFSLAGLETVIAFDLLTFAAAFVTLLFFIHIPEPPAEEKPKESLLRSVKEGLGWLKRNPLILTLILFLAAINLVASIYDAALPAMILSKPTGGETALGIVNTCVGLASLGGSVLVMLLPKPKNRVRVICLTLLISMSTENFILALFDSPIAWCIGAVLGWIVIPMMNANMDVIFRTEIPPEIQGRVFSCRNTLQFFTIPVGGLLGGALVDLVFEPLMAACSPGSPLIALFGEGKGSGVAFLFFVCGFAGVFVCLIFGLILRKYRWREPD
ncbi:MAG: MFS transporter [Bacteroides sp.]|nr:MFS transporter [Eubacterium sp.]MCM1418138.1 MFS transporter [Roseburia sp.]MCM1462237.1 MFS transporter [Bacteroides sp.]